MADDLLRVGTRTFRSRLFLGTGKYATLDLMNRALDASGCDCVTVAVRRANVERKGGEPSLLDALDLKRYAILPNTAGCFTAEDAIRTAHLAREFGLSEMVKLEVLSDPQSLLPDPVATLGSNFEHNFTENTMITNKFLAELGSDNTSVANDIALQVSMSEALALAVGIGVRYNSDPPPLA